jgi:hypothetical protein
MITFCTGDKGNNNSHHDGHVFIYFVPCAKGDHYGRPININLQEAK